MNKNYKLDELENKEGLLVIPGDPDHCMGYIMEFEGKGFFTPGGTVTGITREISDRHNQTLSAGEILGLGNCKIGQCGTFYYKPEQGVVTTFMGQQVAGKATVKVRGQEITFYDGAKRFKGRLRKGEDCFHFKRVT
jgi:hypothetical protein